MRAQVIVVAGPSGSGKSRLCDRLSAAYGWPVVNLDHFYKDGTDESLPMMELAGGSAMVDWDHPDSWHPEQAVAALRELCAAGSVDLPVYDIAANGRVAEQHLSLDGATYVLAEGIFADEIAAGCREEGLLADAVCVRNPRWLTFWRRLSRDLREGRKAPWVLVRRGLALTRQEPRVVARAVAAGCAVVSPDEAYARLSTLVG